MRLSNLKKTIFLVINTLLLNSYCFSQNYSSIIPDGIINELITYEIINSKKSNNDYKILRKRISKVPIKWNNAIINILNIDTSLTFEIQYNALIDRDKQYNFGLKKINELFNENDINYLKEQFDNELNKEWNLNLGKIKLIRNPKKRNYSYSIPLFNIEKNKAIIYKEFYCGSLCAYGSIEIYIFKDESWMHYKSIPLWIS
jgi:hypothetical protein